MPITPRPVYRQSSFAPTRGQNDPRGYIMREIAKRSRGAKIQKMSKTLAKPAPSFGKTGPFGGVSKFGSTGRSETRSGLAKRALQRNGARPANNDKDTTGMAKNHLMKLLGIRG